MIKEIIVVEGKDDTAAIKRAVDADTIETNGSAIGESVLRRIALANERRGIIIFTDPDHAGERIRKIVARHAPGCKHAFLPQELAEYKGDIGIENASPEAIRKALSELRTETAEVAGEVDWSDLMDAGLIVHEQAAERRLRMGKLLGIGYCNGKQFFKRCTSFRISKDEFLAALHEMDAAWEDQA
ncbi:ribonuclease M5 [Paenibacillus oryzae]|jgi:ribonuclease M5|uniref:Ribonuclease M5 n=1 Tax=Paenibacillus oryzae TaxID=1844972 RepID=A0A1A5YA98_9BACL|nr:ribonuclease M5 [Paenibacillus oryzae]OBR62556.1 ribonuclease M5 [Paenibacillus oryzae]